MKKCQYEDLIDDYLLDRLSPSEREAFEDHYFNCSYCFQKLQEQDAIISVIKARGTELFQDIYAREQTKSPSWREKLSAFLPYRQVAVAMATAAVVLLVVLGINYFHQPSSPQFVITDDQVRGESITLISPVIDINSIPTKFLLVFNDAIPVVPLPIVKSNTVSPSSEYVIMRYSISSTGFCVG